MKSRRYPSLIASLIVIFLTLSACSTEGGRSLTLKDNDHPIMHGKLASDIEPRSFTYKEGFMPPDQLYQIVLDDLAESIRLALPDSALPKPRLQHDAVSKSINLIAKFTNDGKNRYIEKSQLKIDTDDRGLIVSFLSGEYYKHRKGEAYQTAKFPLTLSTSNGLHTLTLSFPKDYEYRHGNIGSRPTALPLYSTSDVSTAFLNVFNAARSKKVPFTINKHFEGEFTNQYADDDVYANFFRHSIAGTNLRTIAKSTLIETKIDGIMNKVGVTVYPYRGKSKIVYDAHMEEIFYLYPGGATNYKALPTQADLEKALNMIANE